MRGPEGDVTAERSARIIISCPVCKKKYSIQAAPTRPKLFQCKDGCNTRYTVFPDLTTRKGDARSTFWEDRETLARIESIIHLPEERPGGRTCDDDERMVMEDLRDIVSKVKSKQDGLPMEMVRLERTLEEKQARIRELEGTVSKSAEEVLSLRRELDSLKASIASTSSDAEMESLPSFQGADERFSALQVKFKEQAATLKDALKRLGEMESGGPLHVKEKEVNERMVAWEKAARDQNEKAKALQAREKKLEDNEKALSLRESGLEGRERAFEIEVEAIAREKDRLEAFRVELSDRAMAIETGAQELDRERQELLLKEHSSDAPSKEGQNADGSVERLRNEKEVLVRKLKEIRSESDSLKVENSRLSEENADRAKTLTALEKAMEGLEERTNTLSEKEAELERREKEHRDNVAALASEKEKLTANINQWEDYRVQLDGLRAQLEEQAREMQDVGSALDLRKEGLDSAEKELKDKIQEISLRESELRSREDQYERDRTLLSDRSVQLEDYRSRLDQAREELARAKEDLAGAEERLRISEGTKKKEGSTVNGTDDQKVQKLKEALQRKNDELAGLRAELEKGKANEDVVDRLRAENESLRKEMESLEEAGKGNGVQAEAIEEENRALKERIEALSGELEAAVAKVRDLEGKEPAKGPAEDRTDVETPAPDPERLAVLENREAELRSEADRIEDERGKLMAFREQLIEYQNTLAAQYQQYTAWAQDLNAQKEELEKAKAEMETTPSSASSDIGGDLKKDLEEAKAEVAKVRSDLDKRDQIIIKMQEKLTQAQKSPQSHPGPSDEVLKKREQEIADLRERNSELKTSLIELEGKRSEQDERIRSLEAMASAPLEDASADRDSEISELKEKIATLERSLDEASRKDTVIEELSRDLQGARDRIAAMERSKVGSDAASEERTGALEADKEALQKALDVLRAQLEERDLRITELTSREPVTEDPSKELASKDVLIEKLKNALLKVQGELGPSRERIESLERETAAKDERIALISVLEGKLETSDKDVMELTQRIGELENERRAMDELRGQLEDSNRLIEELRAKLSESDRAFSGMDEMREELERTKAENEAQKRRIEEERAAIAKERDEIGRRDGEVSKLKDRLRERMEELNRKEEKVRKMMLEATRPENLLQCPYCERTFPEDSVKDLTCPFCSKRFGVSHEEVIEMYECPSCGRALTAGIVEKGSCPFCNARFGLVKG